MSDKIDIFELSETKTTVADMLICAGCTSGYAKSENCPWHGVPTYLGKGLSLSVTGITKNEEKSKPLKLNLGSNKKKIYGYVNVDLDPSVEPDLIDDVFKLAKISDNSVDKILAIHVLEHSNIKQSKEVLKRWFTVLKPGGIIQIAVPDLEKLFGLYLWKKDLRLLYSALWGSQQNDFMFHKMGWDFKTLKEDLKEVGFKNPHRYDWKTSDHFWNDSYEQAYVPHLDKNAGELVSLNIEAVKPEK